MPFYHTQKKTLISPHHAPALAKNTHFPSTYQPAKNDLRKIHTTQ